MCNHHFKPIVTVNDDHKSMVYMLCSCIAGAVLLLVICGFWLAGADKEITSLKLERDNLKRSIATAHCTYDDDADQYTDGEE